RTRLWNAEILDGRHPLPHQDAQKRQDGDEPACAGLQHQADDQNTRRQATNDGNRYLAFSLTSRMPRRSNGSPCRVSPRPRPQAAVSAIKNSNITSYVSLRDRDGLPTVYQAQFWLS